MNIYLDNASTTKPKQEVIDAMMPYYVDKWHNPSSLYRKSVDVKEDIIMARNTIGEFIGAKGANIFFTSGGSESNCWAIDGFCKQCLLNDDMPVIITTKIEHKSILECVNKSIVDMYGITQLVSVDKYGFVDLRELEEILTWYTDSVYDYKILVSVQFANNEIGTIQNIKSIAKLAHKYNAIFHTDAVQAFGQIDIDVNDLGIDMLSASGHKIGAPKGIGILYKHKNVDIQPLIYGTQMDNLRGGTENTPYIIGMAKAVELCAEKLKNKKREITDVCNLDNICNTENLTEYLLYGLQEKFDCKLNGDRINRLSNNINVTFPQNITGESLIYMLDIGNIYIASGSACNSRENKPSHVLKAIGLTDEEAMRTVRFTLADDVSIDDIDRVINEIDKTIKLLVE